MLCLPDEEVITLLHPMAEGGDTQSQLRLARLYDNPEEREKAEEWYLEAAGQGNHEAQQALGDLFLDKGQHEEAVKWYQKAADQGNADALFNLASFHNDGKWGLDKDKDQATKLWVRAVDAYSGMGDLTNVGECYRYLGQEAEAVKNWKAANTKDSKIWLYIHYTKKVQKLKEKNEDKKLIDELTQEAQFYFKQWQILSRPIQKL